MTCNPLSAHGCIFVHVMVEDTPQKTTASDAQKSHANHQTCHELAFDCLGSLLVGALMLMAIAALFGVLFLFGMMFEPLVHN